MAKITNETEVIIEDEDKDEEEFIEVVGDEPDVYEEKEDEVK
jgi:hypothetical protein